MPARKWTKLIVIQAIQARQLQGLSLTTVWKQDRLLYEAAKREFGSWHRAMSAAGQSEARPFRRWSEQRVVQAIVARHQQGLSLDATWREDRLLYDAAYRRFKSWERALVAAGVKESYVPRRRWTWRVVIEAIQARHARGMSLKHVSRDDGPLDAAARRYFGLWEKAVAAAGITFEPRSRWTKQLVIEAIQARHQQGLSLTNVRREDVRLDAAAYRHFGGWRRAMIAAGLGCTTTKNRRAEAGLTAAVRQRSGSSTHARKAVRLKRGKWSKQRVIDAIQDRYVRGLPLAGDGDRRLESLRSAAREHFGRWDTALVAAGVLAPGLARGEAG